MPSYPTRIIYQKSQDEEIEWDHRYFEAHKFSDFSHVKQTELQEINPLTCLTLLQKIPIQDYPLYFSSQGIQSPDDLMITHILVPPTCIRPSVPMDMGQINLDDLTYNIKEMLQVNQSIQTIIQSGQDNYKLQDQWYMLQSLFTQYINASTPGLPLNKLKKDVRSLMSRLKGKTGRFRANLSAKRVDYSARTVISPDPNLAIDEVVMPVHMAKELTWPETVNQKNINFLKHCIHNGSDHYPGANYVVKQNGQKFTLAFGNKRQLAEDLQIGDTVLRHLLSKDIVIFNRQPSLHRMSMMAHKVLVQPWNTLRFNECVCTPYNADFDGDEMNIHVPQTWEARAEAKWLMGVSQNLMTPKNGEPIIALTQDFLTTAFLITNKDRFFDRTAFTQILSCIWDAKEMMDIPTPTILKPIELWTGKQIISSLLRPSRDNRVIVNLSQRERNYSNQESMCMKDGFVLFKHSELLSGALGKLTLGSGGKGGLFYVLIRDNSKDIAAKVMQRFSKLSARWITNYGMTISAADVTPSDALTLEKETKMKQAYEKCDDFIKQFHDGTLQNRPGCNAEQTLESIVSGTLSKIRDEVGDICRKKLSPDNAPLQMFQCGSKGSNINLSQMILCVGQQTLSGQRIPNGFTERSLPHFARNSKQPAAKGFVKNSFFSGLNATEFFFHTMAGREGLIDTACKTADTGYMSRRLMKNIEDYCIEYDYSVRSSNGNVVQFRYGDDALEPMQLEEQNSSVNFERLLKWVQSVCPLRQQKTLHPNEIRSLYKQKAKDIQIVNPQMVSESFQQNLASFFESLASDIEDLTHKIPFKSVVNNIKSLTKKQLDLFFDQVWKKYSSSLITPGEAIGAVTAQSIGEPSTQMTLKTFHFAGVASMNITQGVPRINEIINATMNISTPIITAVLKNPHDPISARIVKGSIEKTLLGSITKYMQEVYSQKGCYLQVQLCPETISALHLPLTPQTITSSLLAHKKLGLTQAQISFSDAFSLKIMTSSEEAPFFQLALLKKHLPLVFVQGISTIKRTVIQQDAGSGDYRLLLEGTGLREVLVADGVEGVKSGSNHIMEMASVLGIEAGRESIIQEIRGVMEGHGITVDQRHVWLLADTMTWSGRILGNTRHGLVKQKDSTIMLASFESPQDILFDSGFFQRKDELKGVSECVIMGKNAPVGTGTFDLLWNVEDVQKKIGISQETHLFA